jgi:HD superfamily phosphodiesterase
MDTDMIEITIDRVKNEMMDFFGADRKRIDHALKVLDYAEEINSIEKADPLIVASAAILHDIGIHAAEQKHGSSAGNFQELEGPPIARNILRRNGFAEPDIEHICAIIANHHSAKDIDTPEFRVIWDSDWLVNIPDEMDLSDKAALRRLIEKVFKTAAGKEAAKTIFLKNNKEEFTGKPQ